MSQKGFAPILLLIVASLGIIAGLYYLSGKYNLIPPANPNTLVNESSMLDKDQVDLETTDWERFKLGDVNLQFKLPDSLSTESKGVEYVSSSTNSKSVVQGSQFAFNLQKNDSSSSALEENKNSEGFRINGSTADYNDKEGAQESYFGYYEKDGKYYTYTSSKGEGRLINPTGVITNSSGMKFVKEACPAGEGGQKCGNYSDRNQVIAHFSSPDIRYAGLQIRMDLTETTTEKDFDNILSTFRFID